jgi:NADH-quinone oxidoreductase subunit F
MDDVIFKYRTVSNMTDIRVAIEHGTYKALTKALQMSPDEIIEVVKASGLRGRGGAGFPTGLKWSFMPKDDPRPGFLCCNADESEPGTFKDREIILKLPHMLIEGCAIACRAIRSKKCYIYIRGEFAAPYITLQKAIKSAYELELLGNKTGVDIEIYRGAGAYICGEETALMDSLQGDRGHPREKPPFPAQKGVWGNPTTVNNVETLSAVGPILLNGAEWYKKWGTPKSSGTKIFCLSGHVNKPGNYELPLGTKLRDIIYGPGMGIPGDKQIKAIIPGGSSTPVLDASKLDIPMDYESLAQNGSMLGSGGIIVIDEDMDIVKVTLRIAEFYAHESCGKCTPCHQGCWWLTQILKRIINRDGKSTDIDLMLDICDNIEGRSYCLLGDACAMPVRSFLKTFRSDFEARL